MDEEPRWCYVLLLAWVGGWFLAHPLIWGSLTLLALLLWGLYRFIRWACFMFYFYVWAGGLDLYLSRTGREWRKYQKGLKNNREV